MARSNLDGALLALSPAPPAVALWALGEPAGALPPLVLAPALVSSICLTVCGLVVRRRPRLVPVLWTLALAGALVPLERPLSRSPAVTLTVLLAALTAALLPWRARWREGRGVGSGPRSTLEARARLACLVAVGFWVASALFGTRTDPDLATGGLALSLGVAVSFAGVWLARDGTSHQWRAGAVMLVSLVAALGVASSWDDWWRCLSWSALVPASCALALPLTHRRAPGVPAWWEPVLERPERFLAATFLALCAGGWGLLSLPECSTVDGGIAPVDAAFTAVSAVCVTGLAVLDTPVDFTPTGQLAILVLIQLGGLGIMAFSATAMQLLGRRMSLRHESALADLISPHDPSQLFRTARQVLLFTLCVEGIGALVLTVCFALHGDSMLAAVWRAVFTSISAFCNAGFALQSDSLVGYQKAPWILHTVAALIVLGGLSPAVVLALPSLRRRGRPVSAQIKMILIASAVLLAVGFAFFLAVEWSNTLAGLSVPDRLHNAWFQSVTPRTAGFNSVDTASLHDASKTFMLLAMFVGGSPGGTAGGLKTTTVAVLVMAVVTAIRGRWTVTTFGRRISRRTVYKAAAIATAGVASVFCALVAVQLTQDMAAETAIFEVVSALGTVGLTIGGTAELDGVGKALIMLCMFSGRLGPITLFMFLSDRLDTASWERPEEEIAVG